MLIALLLFEQMFLCFALPLSIAALVLELWFVISVLPVSIAVLVFSYRHLQVFAALVPQVQCLDVCFASVARGAPTRDAVSFYLLRLC